MNSVRLKMNNAKSKFILFGNRVLVSKCISSETNINGEAVSRSPEIKVSGCNSYGAWIYSELMLKTHVKRKCSVAMINLQRIKKH